MSKLKRLKEIAVGTTTASMPFNKLIAPKDKEPPMQLLRRAPNQKIACPNCGFVTNEKIGSFTLGVPCPQCKTLTRKGPVLEGATLDRVQLPGYVLPVPPTKQTMKFCGPAAVRSVMEFYGVPKTEAEVAELCGASHAEGVSTEGILRGLKSVGLDAEAFDNGTQDTVRKLVSGEKRPLLVFWWGHGHRGDGPHASVLVGADDGGIWLMDPEPGMVVFKPWVKWIKNWFTFGGPSPREDRLSIAEYVLVRNRLQTV